ncbi:MAG: translocation/assembly module TamB domain-containing protein [Deltaproteobacteria bacterium]|nr:translocation/assembly module TamB domain-containing protein [Deltaproteobacteria bacterium]
MTGPRYYMSPDMRRPKRPAWRRRRDWGRIVARALCALLGVLGLVPLGLGLAVRLPAVQIRLAREGAALLRARLEISARCDLRVRPWPPLIALEDVVVDASDGGGPFLSARRIVARPRFFSLLAGKLDLGDISIEALRLRAVVAGGRLSNLHYALPPRSATPPGVAPAAPELPLSAVTLTDAQADVSVEGTRIRTQQLDVDATVERASGPRGPGLAGLAPVEISLRSGVTSIDRTHPDPARPAEDLVDEDVLCKLDLRARIEPGALVVRRLDVQGAADLDPDPGSRPSCELLPEDWRRVELRIESFQARLGPQAPRLAGRVHARLPAALAHRLVAMPRAAGWMQADVEVFYDGTSRLPALTGSFAGGELSLLSVMLAHRIAGRVDTSGDRVSIADLDFSWGGARGRARSATIAPFAAGVPLMVKDIIIDGVQFPDMLDDLDAHPHAWVAWDVRRSTLPYFGGTIVPLALSGPMESETRDFAVFDRPFDDPGRRRSMGVEAAHLTGTFRVSDEAVVLSGFRVTTPPRPGPRGPRASSLLTTVSLGFREDLGITVAPGGLVELRDVAPFFGIPWDGTARVKADVTGKFNSPVIEGELAVRDFVFGGFPLGDVTSGRVRFVPLTMKLSDLELRKGTSTVRVPRMQLDFASGADVRLSAKLDTRTPEGLDLRDFFRMVHFDQDPRWADLRGVARGTADVGFVLGGPRDRCGTGKLSVRSQMQLADARLWGEDFDSGETDVNFVWDDFAAGDRSLTVDIHAGVLRKGPGTLLLRAAVRPGGRLEAELIGFGLPLARFSPYRRLFGEEPPHPAPGPPAPARAQSAAVRPEATVSFVAALSGTLDRLKGQADIEVSPLRLGPALLPGSRIQLSIVPSAPPPVPVGRTRCGGELAAPFDRARYDSDPPSGVLALRGQLFGEQVRLDDVKVTQQRASVLSGRVVLEGLDLGALANLLPGVAFSATPPRGRVSADVQIEELPLGDPALAEARLFVRALELGRAGDRMRVGQEAEPVLISGDAARIPELGVQADLGSGLSVQLRAGGTIEHLSRTPVLDLTMRLRPVDLSAIGVRVPWLERTAGVLDAELRVQGTSAQPSLSGAAHLRQGALQVAGFPLALTDINVALRVADGEIKLDQAKARAGTGIISIEGRAPLRGLALGDEATVTLVARGLRLPVAEGVKLTADAALSGSFRPGDEHERTLPTVTGTVSLSSFTYSRPMSFTLDLEQLATGTPTAVETYDPARDNVRFDINVVSPRPLELRNNLADVLLEIGEPGLRLAGTDQRFGAHGTLRILGGSKLMLQGHRFAIDDGKVSFDDASKVDPLLFIHATTEYQRYASSSEADSGTTTGQVAAGSTAGKWRIEMRAYGSADAPKVQFSSDPPLGEEDVLLLLQVGMTRAELERGLAGSLAQSVGIEALTAVTGADQAVRHIVPAIDEIRFGSSYSARTGRPEPTVSLGKRITDNVRASVTSGLTENREVRSNVEWRLGRRLGVEGSYDNVNNTAGGALGNIGADLRWRLEFE